MGSPANPTVDKFGRLIELPSYSPAGAPNITSFAFAGIAPPSQAYVQVDDSIVVEGIPNINNEVLTFNARLLIPNPQSLPSAGAQSGGAGILQPLSGRIVTIQQTVRLGSLQAIAATVIANTEGYLLSLCVTAIQAARRGDCFCRVWLNRGNSTTSPPSAYQLMLADYVTKNAPVAWPGGRIVSPADGPGRLADYNIGNPAAGADFIIQSAGLGRSRIAALRAQLVTSAAVGNRVPGFIVTDSQSGFTLIEVQDTVAIPASTTVIYSLAPGVSPTRGVGNPAFIVLPLASPTICNVGATVQSNTQGLLAGDQWSGILMQTEDWLDNF